MEEYRALNFVLRYDPSICTHAANCVHGLPKVFDIARQPWVDVAGAPASEIQRQVAACPSGALQFVSVDEK